MEAKSEQPGPVWAIVEIMGHRIISGRVSEVSRFGASFCRVEVDLPDGTVAAQEYSGSAIFCITPSDEATVRRRQAGGTYAGPLAIDPPATQALMARRQIVATEIANRSADDDDRDDDEQWDELWSDAVVCEGAGCSKRALFPANHGWTRGEHDGVGLWFCPDCTAKTYGERVGHLLAVAAGGTASSATPKARVCPECFRPIGVSGECINFPKCNKSTVPF